MDTDNSFNNAAYILKFVKNNSLNVLVKPNSSKNEVIGYDDSRSAVKINIKAVPEKGKANLELVKFLRKLLKKDVRIVSGLTGHLKVVRFL